VTGATAIGARMRDLHVSLDGDGSWSGWRAGHQEGPACDGRFGCICYHTTLSRFDLLDDPERVLLRRGDEHNAEFWRRALSPVIAR
jgi:hypothetical protein